MVVYGNVTTIQPCLALLKNEPGNARCRSNLCQAHAKSLVQTLPSFCPYDLLQAIDHALVSLPCAVHLHPSRWMLVTCLEQALVMGSSRQRL